MRISTDEHVADLARGMVFLGTGGGGDPYVGELFLQAELHAGRRSTLIAADTLADDAFVLTIAGIGAPTVILESLVSRRTMLELVHRAETYFGRKLDALVSVEIGGVNTLFPLALGAALDIPVVDADGMGRAFPRLEMTSYGIMGCRATPAVIMDESGNLMMVNAASDRTAEAISRSISASLGAMVWGAFYPMSGRELKEFGVHGTVTQAWEIGRCIREARHNSEDVVGALLALLNQSGRPARLLFKGKVVDVSRETRGAWDHASITVAGSSGICKLELQNEFVIARRDGKVLCMVPDMISVVQSESGEPLTGEMLTFGQRLSVIGYAAHPILRRPESLAVCGPRQFGLEHDFVPLEAL
jgi:uncharacterized protein